MSRFARACLVLLNVCSLAFAAAASRARPNIILILTDDLGYGDLGCYGQQDIRTPFLDEMARTGVRFTDAYAPSPLCAPSRCSIMTGFSAGHNLLRTNSDGPLRQKDLTIAMELRRAGYDTALIGKWGLGNYNNSGAPTRKGFDYFFGYMTHQEAHNYYPPFLWRGTNKWMLPGNRLVRPFVSSPKVTYAPDVLAKRALEFISTKRKRPFFLCFALNLPHNNWEEKPGRQLEVPDVHPYVNEKWDPLDKRFAAMVTRIDTYTGQILKTLKQKGMSSNTIVFFTSDNGPYISEGKHLAHFKSAGPFRGFKRSLYEGGIRMPLLAYAPGRFRGGKVVHEPVALWDLFPTFGEIAQRRFRVRDGQSLMPLLAPKRAQKGNWWGRPLYFEIYSDQNNQFAQACRLGRYKIVRPEQGREFELYDLTSDPGERSNLARVLPTRFEKMKRVIGSLRWQPDSAYDPTRIFKQGKRG